MPTIHLRDGTKVDLCVEDADAPAVLRAFAGANSARLRGDALLIPIGPPNQLVRQFSNSDLPKLAAQFRASATGGYRLHSVFQVSADARN
jgi:hypothetical protein